MNFHDILKTGYLNQAEAKKKYVDAGYKYDSEFSTNNTKIFTDQNNKAHLVSRGTHKFRLDDLKSDLLLGVGLQQYDPRYKQTQNILNKTKEKYGSNVDLYGHSLGGGLISNSKTDGNVYTYNKAAGIDSIGKKINSNQYDYRTSNDLISQLSLLERNKNLKTSFTPPLLNAIQSHNLKYSKKIKI
jgi:hypothetical protein